MKIQFTELSSLKSKPDAVIVLPVGDDKKLSAYGAALDKQAGGLISKAVAGGKFAGKRGQTLSLAMPTGVKAARVILVGTGAAKSLDVFAWEAIGGSTIPAIVATGAQSATFALEDIKGAAAATANAAARIAHGADLRAYRFDKYFTKTPPEDKVALKQFSVATSNSKTAAKAYEVLEKVADGVRFTRDLVSEPANIINPETLAEKCQELEALGVDVQILGEEEMHKLGFGALLGVGQGSVIESKLVIMRYNGLGHASKAQPIAFVGKGVTFDTGGISIGRPRDHRHAKTLAPDL
ncbi:MAG: hypothetical protein EBR02_06930 [Alphaproteobacteria bacterium]|nr:hypothetical protein [Alphaproteobacteria bacterium]